MSIHNLWEEDEFETVSLYLPVPIYNLNDSIESPAFLIVKQLQWSYQHQFWLTIKGYRLLDPSTNVFIRVEETKFFVELAIAISLHLDKSASEIQLNLPKDKKNFNKKRVTTRQKKALVRGTSTLSRSCLQLLFNQPF